MIQSCNFLIGLKKQSERSGPCLDVLAVFLIVSKNLFRLTINQKRLIGFICVVKSSRDEKEEN